MKELGDPVRAGSLMALAVSALSLGLAMVLHHFAEEPLRGIDRGNLRVAVDAVERRRIEMSMTSRFAAVAALILVTFGSAACVMNPRANDRPASEDTQVSAGPNAVPAPEGRTGPLTAALQQRISAAVRATRWPQLNPTLEQAANGPLADPEVLCTPTTLDPQSCTWGSPDAVKKIVLVGDSVAVGYSGPIREIVLNSAGAVQFRSLAVGPCVFANDPIVRPAQANAKCTPRNQSAVDFINATKPDVVVVSNGFRADWVVGHDRPMSFDEWGESLRQIVDKFRGSTGKVVFLSRPAGNLDVQDCVRRKAPTPADCMGGVDSEWAATAEVERHLADSLGGVWIDSRPWFCTGAGGGELCPSFVGSTPTRRDTVLMTPEYGHEIYPVIKEALAAHGLL